MAGDGGRVGPRAAGEVQRGQRKDAVLVIMSTGEQPFSVIESSLRHPQFGQRGANLPLDTGAGMRGPTGGQAQCHFGFVRKNCQFCQSYTKALNGNRSDAVFLRSNLG